MERNMKMFRVEEVMEQDGHDCWGRPDEKTVYTVYCDDSYICKFDENPKVLIDKFNELLNKN